MADVYITDIAVVSPAVGTLATISDISLVSSVTAGDLVDLGEISAINSGDTEGTIYLKLVENPNTPTEAELILLQIDNVQPGDVAVFALNNFLVPDTPGIWSLGIKVWGIDEEEPSWSVSGKVLSIKFP